MVEKVVIAETADRAVTKEGAKNVRYKSFFPIDGTRKLSGSYIEVGVGGNTVMHSHDAAHIHVVISGNGYLVSEIDGEIPIKSGDATYIPGNVGHYFKNCGESDLCLLAFRNLE